MARKAQTTETFVYQALMRQPIPRAVAERILEAFSEMTGETYTFENVDIPIEEM
jgi:hypothetical protein